MSGMSEQSERVAYIIGNGPSRKSVRREKLGQGVVYAANVEAWRCSQMCCIVMIRGYNTMS